MSKKIKLIICWSIVAIGCLLAAGLTVGMEKFIFKKTLDVIGKDTLQTTEKYVPRIMQVIGASIEQEEGDETKNSASILVATYSSDSNAALSELTEEEAANIPALSYVYRYYDKDGNLVSSGTKIGVENDICKDDCIHSTVGYICVDKYFENDLGMQIEELLGDNEDVSIRVDSYAMNGNECIPLLMTVLYDDGTEIGDVDCSAVFPAELQKDVVNDSPLYVHKSEEMKWSRDEFLIESREYLDKWVADNAKLTGSGVKSKTNLKEGYVISYSKCDDYSYYVLTHTQYAKNNKILSTFLLAIAGLLVIGTLFSVIINVTSKKKEKTE